MSHQRYPSVDPVKEPHSVSLKVLRPSLVTQHPLTNPISSSSGRAETIPASLAYRSTNSSTNPDPFLLTPVLNLPPSFGSAYVGETFSCTLCANHDIPSEGGAGRVPYAPTTPLEPQAADPAKKKKWIRDVRIEAEMKTPGSSAVQKLRLGPGTTVEDEKKDEDEDEEESKNGTDLDPGRTLQRIVNFDLKEEGNHVLAVTVSYYEATETSGRTRTFRKLYQFICKGSLIVRTKVGVLPATASRKKREDDKENQDGKAAQEPEEDQKGSRRWILEAQLENCSEDAMQLDHVGLNLEPASGLRYRDANWAISGSAKPVLHPGEVEQVCFVVEEDGRGADVDESNGKIVFGVLGIGWKTEMGNRGFLSTGKLGVRTAK
ncbi:putative Trafficking protein particle complex subunit 13 [Seiridium cardinale]|uniref:Trafficking protein particle complex subunit 13 n=1 Tax=Seiridium cardinale TaxID=138064 RepID=A0ABR2XZQ7_9PEZI